MSCYCLYIFNTSSFLNTTTQENNVAIVGRNQSWYLLIFLEKKIKYALALSSRHLHCNFGTIGLWMYIKKFGLAVQKWSRDPEE